MIVKGLDGSSRETFPDGRIVYRSGTGYQVEIFPDGREIENDRFGQKITSRLPFFQVSENVANGHFVETMQACWMLSAGHRSNILARHWTHVGVAVAKSRGMVWGVQVFARQ